MNLVCWRPPRDQLLIGLRLDTELRKICDEENPAYQTQYNVILCDKLYTVPAYTVWIKHSSHMRKKLVTIGGAEHEKHADNMRNG